MDTHHADRRPTPQEAREQLATAQARRGSSPRDRLVHATGTAVLGGTAVLFMAAQTLISGLGEEVLSTVVVAAVWLGAVWWVESAARTVPRRSRLWSRTGLGASLVVGLVVVMPWLNLSAQTEPNTWPMVLTGAAVASVPSVVAAAVIARRRR